MKVKHLVLCLGILFCFNAQAKPIRVLIVTPEVEGVFKTGGLAVAISGLAHGLQANGIEVEIFMPRYSYPHGDLENLKTIKKSHIPLRDFKVPYTLERGYFNDLSIVQLNHSESGERDYFFNPPIEGEKPCYGSPFRIGEVFGAFSMAAAEYAIQGKYDLVIHNDWTTGLVAKYIKKFSLSGGVRPQTLFMVHNMAYQGVFPKEIIPFLNLSWEDFHMHGLEYHGKTSYLKAGLVYADHSATVSEQYAQELKQSIFGVGLEGVIEKLTMKNRFSGILNGIRSEEWRPTNFNQEDFSNKEKGKIALFEELGLAFNIDHVPPLFVLSNRLSEQKGFSYLIPALEDAVAQHDIRIVVIGDGEKEYKSRLEDLARRFPEKFIYEAFSDSREVQITRYGDFFVNAAWFEPSGVNQMNSMANATLPLLSRVGGLKDSVIDGVNGFHFDVQYDDNNKSYDIEKTAKVIGETIQLALNTYWDKLKLDNMRRAAMAVDNSWEARAKDHYLPLIETIVEKPVPKSCRSVFHKI